MAANNTPGSGSFPLHMIEELQGKNNYIKWTRKMDNWLIFNNLKPFTPATYLKAMTAMKDRMEPEAYHLVKDETNPERAFRTLASKFKPEGTGVYTELVHRLHSITLESSKDINDYTRKFREVTNELTELHDDCGLPEPYLCHLFLMGLGEAYHTFFTVYIQSHNLFGINAVSLSDISSAASNEEARLRAPNEPSGIAMFARRGNAGQSTGRGRNNNRVNKSSQEGRKGPCSHCKDKNLSSKHDSAACWQLYPWLKPMKFKSEEERKKYPTTNPPTTTSQPNDEPVFANLAADDLFYRHDNTPVFSLVSSVYDDLAGLIVVDSACSRHAFSDRNAFLDLRPVPTTCKPIAGIGGKLVQPTGMGTVRISLPGRNVQLRNVMFVPNMGANLLSVSQLLDSGVKLDFKVDSCTLTHSSLGAIEAKRRYGIFVFESKMTPLGLNAYSVPDDPIQQLWHARMGHLGQQNVARLPQMATGVDFSKKVEEELTCECCVQGRQKSAPHKDVITPGQHPMELIHSDVCGPIKPTGFDGSRYFVTFKCDCTNFSEVFCIKNKSMVFLCFRRFKSFYERDGRRIRRFRTDNGGEYMGHDFQQFLADNGIFHEPTVPGNPQQNGESERLGLTLMSKMHPTLLSSGLDKDLWPEVLRAVNYITIRCPVAKMDNKSPYEAWWGHAPSLGHLRTLGSFAWARNRLQKKLVDKSERCLLVGYEGDGHIYRLYCPRTGKVLRASSVHIEERKPTFISNIVPPNVAAAPAPPPSVLPRPPPPAEPPPAKRLRTSAPGEENMQKRKVHYEDVDPIHPAEPQLPPLYDAYCVQLKRIIDDHPALEIPDVDDDIFGPDPLGNDYSAIAMLSHANTAEPFEPKTYDEAISRSMQRMQWELAMDDEYKSLMDNKTWSLTTLPQGRTALRGKWVYALKRGANGEVVRYKARWVVRGFEQREGLDYNETFASVVKPMSYKAILAIAAAMDWDIEQMDVKTAFLYGQVEEEIFVEQPKGYNKGNEDKVCRLNKALYGLKQSPRVWYNTFASFIKTLGFDTLDADSSVFISPSGTMVALYVDDLLITGPNKQDIYGVKKALNSHFHMTDLGPCCYWLGMSITRNRQQRVLHLGQRAYLEKVVRDFGQWECKSTDTPMEASSHLQKAPEGYQANAYDKQRYQQAVGSLMYAMLGTRPDIAFPVSAVSRYASNPTQAHWGAVKRILRYLRSTLDYQLTFQGTIEDLTGYTDSDWAGDHDTRRSTAGFIFHIGSGAISWQSKRQPIVALSTCEAEYIGQTQAAKEAIWLRNLLRELRPQDKESAAKAVIIFGDNQGAIALAKNPEFHARSKHIAIRHHFIREKVSEGTIDLQYTPTECQVADGLTKPLARDKFIEFRNALGLEYVPPKG